MKKTQNVIEIEIKRALKEEPKAIGPITQPIYSELKGFVNFKKKLSIKSLFED